MQKRSFSKILDADQDKRQEKALACVHTAIRAAIEQKGLDVRGLDLRNITNISDFFVVISGTSERHVRGIADKVELALKDLGEKPMSVSGSSKSSVKSDWVLLDYGDFVVHVFHEPTRQYYEFDDLWKNAEQLTLSPDLEIQARTLRTGIYQTV